MDSPDRPRRRWIWRWVRITVGVYLGICLVFVFLESRLLYPGAFNHTLPEVSLNAFVPGQPVVGEVLDAPVPATGGGTITGRILTPPAAAGAVLCLHGNGIRAFEMDGWIHRLAAASGSTVLIAEYRGFDQTDLTPTEASTIDDAHDALRFLAKATGVPAGEIVVYGRSLGGGVAGGLVARAAAGGVEIRSVVLDSTFDSAVDVGAAKFPWLPVRLLMRNRYDNVAALSDFRGRLVQLHGTRDSVIPYANGVRLFESVPATDKRLITLEGKDHLEAVPDATLTEVFDWLRRPAP